MLGLVRPGGERHSRLTPGWLTLATQGRQAGCRPGWKASPVLFACPGRRVFWALSACLSHVHSLQKFTKVLSYLVLTTLGGWLSKGIIILSQWMRKQKPRDILFPAHGYTGMCPQKTRQALFLKAS